MHYVFSHTHEGGEAINSGIITILGIFSMTLSLIGNLKQIEEFYPLFLQKNGIVDKKQHIIDYLLDIPLSLFISCLSDFVLLIYGLYVQDIIIVVYGGLNSLLVILVIITIQFTIGDLKSNMLDPDSTTYKRGSASSKPHVFS